MMRTKIIFLVAGLLIVMPFAVSAQTDTISQLQAQIQALQDQIKRVQQQLLQEAPRNIPTSILPTLPQKPVAGSIQESPKEATENIPSFNRDLFFGMRNNPQVSDLQEFLTDQGYYAGPISGNFGLLTLSSVKKFQQVHGIKSTGYFGPWSRAIANEIVQKLVGQICPREERCEGDILPVEKIFISAEDVLEGTVGEYLAIGFKASGGSGKYSLHIADGDVPGVNNIMSRCEVERGCQTDSIFLTGVPAKSGVFGITFLAKDQATAAYGKERFTIVIKDKIVSGKPPVISGVKGPTVLRVRRGGNMDHQRI